MLRALSRITVCLGLIGPVHALDGLEPEIAYIARDDVEVRSGPGNEFYAVQRLPSGTRVEIYRREGDWQAIRPPLGSFSWLPGDAIRGQDDSDVAYTTRQVRTRIGSLLSNDRNVAYVTLDPGDAVRLVEHLPEDGPRPAWCRIEPPAGEFRWVHHDDLQSEPTPSRETNADPPRRHAQSEGSSAENELDDSARSLSESLAAIRETMQTILPEIAESEPDDSQVVLASADEPAVTELSASGEGISEPVGTVDQAAPGLLPYPSGTATADSSASLTLATELTKIAAELAGQVSRSPATWNLGPLRRRTQTVIDVAETAEVREQGTSLLARIAQFEDIRRRHRLLDRAAADQALATGKELPRAGSAQFAGTLPPENTAGYDGFGWLMPVATQNRRVPRYVLTDQQGNILQFVTPSPGLNLSRYANQKVGIYGTRGFLPSMKQPHLVAERVVNMNSVR